MTKTRAPGINPPELDVTGALSRLEGVAETTVPANSLGEEGVEDEPAPPVVMGTDDVGVGALASSVVVPGDGVVTPAWSSPPHATRSTAASVATTAGIADEKQ